MKPSYRIAELERIGDAFRQRAIEAERERDEAIAAHRKHAASLIADRGLIRERAEAAERERDEMRSSQEHEGDCLIDALASRDEWRLRAVTAEAEIARRDAAAGEPVALQVLGDSGKWMDCRSREFAEAQGFVEFRKLYTAAPPAVLPVVKLPPLPTGRAITRAPYSLASEHMAIRAMDIIAIRDAGIEVVDE